MFKTAMFSNQQIENKFKCIVPGFFIFL